MTAREPGPRRVYYNSHADEALYGMIREAAASEAGEPVELLALARDDDAERRALLGRAEAAIVAATPLTGALIAAAPRLAFVHHQGVGYHDTVDAAALAARGIPLALTPGGTAESVAEHAVLLILAVLRRLPFADAELRAGRFHVNALRPVSRELRGLRVGLVGAGRIGRALAARLAPFGPRLAYFDPAGMPEATEREFGLERLGFEALLGACDVVSLHLPLTPGTRRLIGAEALARMKRGSYLVNTARGGLVDEAALTAALTSGHLAGAALDVFDPEPPSPSNPLLALPNVVVTPHVSAGTRDAFTEKLGAVFANLRRFWAGEPVHDLVDLGGAAGRAA